MSRTYRDPIHKEIYLDSKDPVENLLIKLIDSQEVQRLRWIRQLGTSWFTFHGAEHSRFTHSLGAMHIARLMLKQLANVLAEKNPSEDKIEYSLNGAYAKSLEKNLNEFNNYDLEQHKAVVLCAALLHDIGHGPFSHSCEEIISIKHEEWTERLIVSTETEVNKILNSFDPSLANKIIQLLKKQYPIKFLSNIVSSQLDCDRFDYLLRDSYYTGTSYGNFDLSRVIGSISINLEKDCLVIPSKGMLAVEDYLYARYSMYLQVYQHNKCLATDALLQKLFKRVKMLAHNRRIAFIEHEIYQWVTSPQKLTIQQFLQIDDSNILHHIKHWVHEKDFILKDLAKRFIHRKLFKASQIDKSTSIEQVREDHSKFLRQQNLDPDYYLATTSIAAKPYSFYNPELSDSSQAIFIDNGNGSLEEISTLSHIVSSLVQGDYENRWLLSTDYYKATSKSI